MGIAVPFPATQPRGYEWLDGEPAFDSARHLQLEAPDEVLMLADIGYDDAEIATKATPVALSSPFRMLSDEGRSDHAGHGPAPAVLHASGGGAD